MQFQVIGDVMQAVVVHMALGEEVRAEAGAMMYMTSGIQMDTKLDGGLMGGLKRVFTGESFMMPRFRCMVPQASVAFAAPTPGRVKDLAIQPMTPWLLQRDSFLFSAGPVETSIAFTKRIGVGFFGGEGFVLQKLAGSGLCYVHAGGNLVEFDLRPAEVLKIDTGCVVGFEQTVDFDIEFIGGFKNTIFGGEGLFLATLRGPGKAMLQTLPFSRLAGQIAGGMAEGSGGLGGVAGTFGDIGRIFGGRE